MKIIILLSATNNLQASAASSSVAALRTDLTYPRGGYVIYSTAWEHGAEFSAGPSCIAETSLESFAVAIQN